MTMDDFILKCWGVDASGWTFRTTSDQWFEVVATSDTLGEFRTVAGSSKEMSENLNTLFQQIATTKQGM